MSGMRMNSGSAHGDPGMTMIELMAAIAIASFLLIAALTVFTRSSETFRINDSIARLQENARFAFDVLEPEIRMAGYWGLHSGAQGIEGRAGTGAPLSGAVAGDCGTDWAIDLDTAIAAANGRWEWPGCDPGPAGAGAAEGADTIVVRRAGVRAVMQPARDTLYIQSTLAGVSALFAGVGMPAGFDAGESETHELVVNGFYVSGNSTLGTRADPVPSLRRKRLRHGNAGDPRIVDEEVLPGVEDLQVRLGVDTDLPGEPGRGMVDRYVDPDSGILDPDDRAFVADAAILSVRIWLRLRSDRRESGLPPTAGFDYADRRTAAIGDGYRRLVVSNTVYLRNARPVGQATGQ